MAKSSSKEQLAALHAELESSKLSHRSFVSKYSELQQDYDTAQRLLKSTYSDFEKLSAEKEKAKQYV